VSTLVPGKLVTPTVRLEKPLGEGGMSSVWVAEHLTLRTHVVVKVMASELVADDDARARFSREAAAAAAVKSPHVVQVFDHGIVDGAPFIVMELLEGEDLRTRMARTGALMLRDVEAMVNQTCKALTQAHRAGVVHRDIKPDNLFLCKSDDGEIFVKLLDFGLAKVAGPDASVTKTGALLGTPYYMSPEQATGLKNLDFRTDLWSLGVVAFEAMTGQKAFDGNSIGTLAVAILHGPLPVPSQRNPLLPPSVDEWFARACARAVADRFPSAKDFADAFRTASTGAPVTGANLPNFSSTAPLGLQTPAALRKPMKTAPLAAIAAPAAKTPLRTAPMPAFAQSRQEPSGPTLPAAPLDEPIPMASPRPTLVIMALVAAALLLAGGVALYLRFVK
jgi:serine/threonine protein kinase